MPSNDINECYNIVKGEYGTLINRLGVEDPKNEIYGFFQAFSHVINMFMWGKKISVPLSEGSLGAYFITPIFVYLLTCIFNYAFYFGEMCLVSSTWRRNKQHRKETGAEEVGELEEIVEEGEDIEEGEEEEEVIVVVVGNKQIKTRRRIGQKTDCIGRRNGYEFMAMEIKKPGTVPSLIEKDQTKIIKGMKNMLDFNLTKIENVPLKMKSAVSMWLASKSPADSSRLYHEFTPQRCLCI